MAIRKRTWQSGGTTKTGWLADYRDSGGVRRQRTFPTKKAAEAWLAGARHELAHGIHTADSESVTVSEAARIWLAKGEADDLERATLAMRESHIRVHIAPAIGGMKLSRLTTPMVESYRDALVRKNSRATARKVLTSLKSIIGEAQRRGLIANNAAWPVRVDLKRRHERRLQAGVDFPTLAEAGRIIEAAIPRWRPVLVVALFTGLRASELRGLNWRDVDFDSHVIRVEQRMDRWNSIGSPKSKAGRREVPMTPLALNTLREWRLACPASDPPGLVFPNTRGRPEKHYRDIGLHQALAAAGIEQRYKFHALRHWYVSWLISQGFNVKRISEWAGHGSVRVTLDVYGHLFPAEADDAAKLAAAERAVIGMAAKVL